MNEDKRNISYDEGLRRAIARRELQLPHMSGALNERLMQRMNPPQARNRRLWIGAVAASVVIVVAIATVWLVRPSHQGDNIVAAEYKKCKNSASVPMAEPKPDKPVATLALPQAKKTVSQRERTKETVRSEMEELIDTNASDSVELTEVQKAMAGYVVQLSKTCGATCLPRDCDNSGGMIYVFPDDEQTDVFGRLKSVVAWVDTDSPSVRLFSAFDQMTLELDGDNAHKGVNELWLADRRNGYVYLYHAQVKKDAWAAASCYIAFLDGKSYEQNNKRSVEY